MDELEQRRQAAFKTEHSTARKLAARTGIDFDAALHATLQQAAGPAGLAQLLAERAALAAAARARTQARDARLALAEQQRRSRHDGVPTPWRAWFDGSAHPNPGRCGIGAVLEGPQGQRVEISAPAGHGSSSEAEYAALLAVLGAAVGLQARGLTVYGDSRVVIDDVNGSARAAPSLHASRAAALALLAQLGEVALRWIPRHKNGAADRLSQLGVAAGADGN